MAAKTKPAATKPPALDIFRVISNINAKNTTLFSILTDEERKGFQPYVLQRWLYTTPHPIQFMLLNEYCNKFLNSVISKHPELVYKLLTVCGVKKDTRYTFLAPKTKKSAKALPLNIIAEYYNVSHKIANQYVPLLSNDAIIDMGHALGYQHDELKQLKK